MSEYTEAIAYINGNEGNKDFQEMWNTIYEALEIANRLEQAENNIPNACDVCLNERGKTCHEIGVCSECIYWTEGYRKALANIRGDTE